MSQERPDRLAEVEQRLGGELREHLAQRFANAPPGYVTINIPELPSFDDPRQALICRFPGGGAGVFVGTPSQCEKKRAEIEAQEPGTTFELQPAPGGSPRLPQNPDR